MCTVPLLKRILPSSDGLELKVSCMYSVGSELYYSFDSVSLLPVVNVIHAYWWFVADQSARSATWWRWCGILLMPYCEENETIVA